MASKVEFKATGLLRKYGTVKWFGGVNSKTGRENHFGFLEDLTGKDVFLHKREWRGRTHPTEGELLTYLEEEKDGKFSARQAEGLHTAHLLASEWYSALCAPPLNAGKLAVSAFQGKIEEKLRHSLSDSGPEDLRLLLQISQQPGAPSVFAILSSGADAPRSYALLLEAGGLRVTDPAPWAGLSHHVASHFEAEIAAHLGSLEPEVARERCSKHLAVLPSAVLTHLLAKGVFTTTDQLGPSSLKKVYEYVSSAIIRGTASFPEYLRASFEASLVTPDHEASNPILRDFVDNLRFKKSLFEKNSDFIEIYSASPRLHRNVEIFILHHLFGLIVAGNDPEVVYGVFMQRLWESLTSNALPLEHRTTQLQSLFPACITMGLNLSCEAVHWPKQNRFLCRGSICTSHKTLPDPAHHFLDFNIYDWLSHYGIDYAVSEKPQAKDFPIKLASYFNRLREILPVLRCRSCGDLMLPNMKYARTQYKEVVDGVVEVKEMAAAYRLTVFHCNNSDCEDLNVGHYISHCVGFGCYHIIDSRDLKRRCTHGRYICSGCGSCCPDHRQSHPIGFCAACGGELEVWSENVRGRQTTYSRKYVKCNSESCGFTISGDALPAKFSRLAAKNDTAAADQPFDL